MRLARRALDILKMETAGESEKKQVFLRAVGEKDGFVQKQN